MKMVKVGWRFNPEPHWACERCIVRAMCQEDSCYMTEMFHYLCLDCKKNKTCKKKCRLVERTELFDHVSKSFGNRIKEQLIKNTLEQSLFYQLSKVNPHENTKWWTNGY